MMVVSKIHGRNTSRRGAAAPLLIALMPALIAAMLVATQLSSLRHRHLELQIATDAASLAGTNGLVPAGMTSGVDNDLLLFSSAIIPNSTRDLIFSMVRDFAVDYASRNQFLSQGVALQRNDANVPQGELVIGTMNQPFDSTFDTNITTNPWDLYSPRYNAVQVAVRRGGPIASPFVDGSVSASVRSFVDRDVIGFKVQGSSVILSGATPAIPVLPLAIRSDFLTNPPTDAGSWDHQIIHRNGPDDCSIATGVPVCGNPPGPPVPDGIPEIRVTFTGLTTDNGQMGAIPITNTVAGATAQISTGITFIDLAPPPFSGQLTFTGATNQIILPRLAPTAGDFAGMAAALSGIVGQRRIWMLYNPDVAFYSATDLPIVGFVAARIMRVTLTPGVSVSVDLQPTMMITCDAITEFNRRSLGPRSVFGVATIFNPYVCRVRISQ